jgi:TRAP-type C4-dicarboxylate transport system permease small subunit
MAATFTFGAAMTLRAGGHIRVTLVLVRVSPRTRRWMETVLALIGMGLCGFLAWAMTYFTWRSFDSGQTSVSSGTLV